MPEKFVESVFSKTERVEQEQLRLDLEDELHVDSSCSGAPLVEFEKRRNSEKQKDEEDDAGARKVGLLPTRTVIGIIPDESLGDAENGAENFRAPAENDQSCDGGEVKCYSRNVEDRGTHHDQEEMTAAEEDHEDELDEDYSTETKNHEEPAREVQKEEDEGNKRDEDEDEDEDIEKNHARDGDKKNNGGGDVEYQHGRIKSLKSELAAGRLGEAILEQKVQGADSFAMLIGFLLAFVLEKLLSLFGMRLID